jgi:hypothetical protein
MLGNFLKGNHFELTTATMPGLWGTKGLDKVSSKCLKLYKLGAYIRCTKLKSACGLRSGKVMGQAWARGLLGSQVDDRQVIHDAPSTQVRKRR